jgi:spore coat polysaccharide biosynthesis protein SpsF
MSNVLAIIQARMGSKRLPGKVLLPIGGVPLIEIAWKKACEAFGEENVVVAMPHEGDDSLPLENFLRVMGAPHILFTGDPNDVLSRFYGMAVIKSAKPDTVIVRVTPDDHRKHYLAMRQVASGVQGIPVEIGGEAFTFAQLKEWHETVTDPFLREHIGHLITPDPVSPPDDGLPWSIDTAEDLARANASPRIPAFTGEIRV